MDLQPLYEAAMQRQTLRRTSNLPPLNLVNVMAEDLLQRLAEAYEEARAKHGRLEAMIREAVFEQANKTLTGRALTFRVRLLTERQFNRELQAVGLHKPTLEDARSAVVTWFLERTAAA